MADAGGGCHGGGWAEDGCPAELPVPLRRAVEEAAEAGAVVGGPLDPHNTLDSRLAAGVKGVGWGV